MRSIFEIISRVVRNPSTEKDDGSRQFIARCENFRLLLAANNKALEIMAEMSEEARLNSLFGMSHVRSQSLKVSANVRQMIERLCRMNPGKYDALKDVFNIIVMEMEKASDSRSEQSRGPLILTMDEICAESISETGSKMAMLGEIRSELGLKVPEGFSITASAFMFFMENSGLDDEINRLIQITDGNDLNELQTLEASIKHAIDLAAMPIELEDYIEGASSELLKDRHDLRLAIRSSALGEDSGEASFAGQFLSVLGVSPENITDSYRAVVASMYSATAMTYLLNQGLREDELVMCVGCLEMIESVAGGVIYTRDPIGKHKNALIISGVPGHPCSIVDGSALADTWVMDRADRTLRDVFIADKEWQCLSSSNGQINRVKVSENRRSVPSIPYSVIIELAEIALRIEKHFNCPQDIEWVKSSDGQIYILQCRPLSVAESQSNGDSIPKKDEHESLAILSNCIPASHGFACGEVVIVETDDDMFNFPDGAILLTYNAKPRLAALLPRAGALISEHGSATGHLANVAREFGIPAFIGITGAVEKLSGVGVVSVNTATGRIYRGFLSGQNYTRDNLAVLPQNNPVITALRNTLPFIVPLSLTDPDSSKFTPSNCASLHDITRFCHEKAVAEMFRENAMSAANAKRLKGERLLQYWLIDLGGGTSSSVDDKYISLSDIKSNTMKALWIGMTQIPWDGPPPVQAAGLMSVISEAACNPALAPGMSNNMGDRNYFIVSRNYCNLQSRFGFHFCTVEGYAGDDPDENYAFFQFSGGGADKSRRMIRSWLIAGILEKQGFIVDVKEDSLFARIEGVAAEAVEQALAVAGYLLVHTRQIDMVMSDSNAYRNYQVKFAQDIEAVLSSYSIQSSEQGRSL
ncbi:PEP/pyruvate-binding domain-containing protein [Maridesulfovibrio ferrireducens]|uniref:PEP/pyruvate-binding domain-containing protein n=1 Tax=Maridesulfovibrio ferrireducens TaxID=246191 RepID=UPI001A211FA7|nr:PEP/pyruvate-binding domain-containing protein [Maridesulfovibrio ferrireducens]MBI9109934.1 phosphoenolpyruvate synthase [Maridesulfovibrio ferrireducens]